MASFDSARRGRATVVDPRHLVVDRLTRITAAHDLGRVVNPLLAEGQVEGGVAQGLGLALMEEYIPGRTENLHDYLIPTTGDMPEVKSIFVEVPDPEGPMGLKGLGEHVLIPTAPAILNAIRDATGALVTQLPATPTRVLDAMRAARVVRVGSCPMMRAAIRPVRSRTIVVGTAPGAAFPANAACTVPVVASRIDG